MINLKSHKIKSTLLAGVLLTGTAAAVGFYPQSKSLQPQVTPPTQPIALQPINTVQAANLEQAKVEVVFVLDTTSSMSGLIDAAKNNIWSIANSMANAQPAPQMHMGLVAFRDRGDAYVTKVLDLSQDLDSMYASLMDFKAQGGGDGPESVNAALYDAVHSISWSQDESYKVIFLVGDAPPHMDYADDVKYPTIIKQAQQKGIVVNSIQAGTSGDTKKVWQHIASLNQGAFFQVEQGGNAVAVTTPYDEKLAALSRQLDQTRLFYGSEDQRKKMEAKTQAAQKLAAAAPASVQAKRAEYNRSDAGAKNLFAESELIEDMAAGKVALDSIAEAELPKPLLSMSKKDQAAFVEKTSQERKRLKQEIEQLAEQRQSYIKAQLEDKEVDESLDGQIYQAVREQAKTKGLNYADRPVF